MSIESVLEGKGLVVESKQETKKEEVGVSKVIDKNELKSSAMIGQIEDIISTIKILPGVSYSGGMNATFSVRGGDPSDFTAIYEGFTVKFPYHWNGMYSIFNPHLVDTLTFFTGILPAKVGSGSSSVMFLNYINPEKKFNFYYNSATSAQEVLFKIPVGLKNAGILLGARITFLDLIMAIMKGYFESQDIFYTRSPYIYDVYFKWYWEITERFKWTFNNSFCSDGIGMKQIERYIKDDNGNIVKERDIIPTFDFKWYNYYVFAFNKFKILPTDKFFIEILTGYEYLTYSAIGSYFDNGKKAYFQDFKDFMTYLATLPDTDPQKIFFKDFLTTYQN